MTGIQLCRLDGSWALKSNLVCYLPAAIIVLLTALPSNLGLGIVQAFFFLGITFLTHIFRTSEDVLTKRWTLNKLESDKQLETYRRTEFMKSHFPRKLRKMVEQNEIKIEKRRVYAGAVVGFVDIVGSTTIANTLTLLADWQLKEAFIDIAGKRAVASNLIVLSHLGDGFMFLANFNETGDWPLNVLAFYEGLIKDFETLNYSMGLLQGGLNTGLKFGISLGPSVVGFLGADQSYFTAMGPDVNLAARLCAKANTNELVVSSRVWHVLKHVAIGWNTHNETFDDLKGFHEPVPAMRIEARAIGETGLKCPACGQTMSITRNSDGFIDATCPNQDNHEKFTIGRKPA